jgi:hypothetical protein
MFALLAASLASAAAAAATITLMPASDVIPAIIIVEGEIEAGDERKFIDHAIPLETAVVALASPGGNTLAAIEIGKAIRLKSFITLVSDGQECASACALVWLSGIVRFMGQDARIGFHASYELTDQGAIERGAVNAIVGGYLTMLGYSPFQIARFTEAPPDAMAWFSAKEFREIAVEVQVIEEDAAAGIGPRSGDQPKPQEPPSPAGGAPEPKQFFAMKGWTNASIKTGETSYPALVVRLVDANDNLSGHVFVGCPPAEIGPYLEFAIDDLEGWPDAPNTFAWINDASFEASVSDGSIFVLVMGRNFERVKTLSTDLLRPGPSTLRFGSSTTPDFMVTFYDWTTEYSQRYEAASGDRFAPMRSFVDACPDIQSDEAIAPSRFRTLPNGTIVRIR